MKVIEVSTLKQWMDDKVDFQLIDIRERYEYDWCHIEGCELIPMGEILNQVDRISRDKEVVMHCNSGKRAEALIDVLESNFQFNNLINLTGGIEAWVDKYAPEKVAER
ncbi:rhodanese-like domain-containing protein [bacterium SCSIO 12741]|nr:rhodanese-like domain-containing protein [bacterium SCSIO 12741]